MRPLTARNLLAGEALTRYAVCDLDGSGDLLENDTVTDASFGVVQDSAADGDEVNVVVVGPTKAIAGGAVSQGDFLQVTTGGKVVTDDGSTSGRFLVGKALEDAAADGDIFEIYFDPDNTSES
jgi:hypothetical protein